MNGKLNSQFNTEVIRGERFQFGANWQQFLKLLDDDRIAKAETSLQQMLEAENLQGKTFLDIGSGSGLFSLAARRLGAKVHSLDYDPDSVACTQELKRRYFPSDGNWYIEQGSVLDEEYLNSLGQFDIVYSWGVLHHTGAMWQALDNASHLVTSHGRLLIAIYDETPSSHRWQSIKYIYTRLPKVLKSLMLVLFFIRSWGLKIMLDLMRGNSLRTWQSYGKERGMSPWYDLVDWVGGYPFEVATADSIFDFYRTRGFKLLRLKLQRGGCNEFVFESEGLM
jgi:2-polyprenyl-3-methyl-5-hydroxy-6-metoxy-1,4-benzoquinol methylase